MPLTCHTSTYSSKCNSQKFILFCIRYFLEHTQMHSPSLLCFQVSPGFFLTPNDTLLSFLPKFQNYFQSHFSNVCHDVTEGKKKFKKIMLHVFHYIIQLKIIHAFQNGFSLLSISEGSKTWMSFPTKTNHFHDFFDQSGAHTPVFVNIFSSLCSMKLEEEVKGFFKIPTIGNFKKGTCHEQWIF